MPKKPRKGVEVFRTSRGLLRNIRSQSTSGSANQLNDYSANSQDWFSIVDFRYLAHLVTDWDELVAPKEGPDFYFQVALHREEDPNFVILDDVIRNSDFRVTRMQERKGHDDPIPIVDSNVLDTYGFDIPPERIPLELTFFQRCTGLRQAVSDESYITDHMKLQAKFNAQIRATARAQSDLEGILVADLTDPQTSDSLKAFRGSISYDLGIFSDLKGEVDRLNAGWNENEFIFEERGKSLLDFYLNILNQRSTSFDLARAVFLYRFSGAIQDLVDMYHAIEEEPNDTKGTFARTFLGSIDSESELKRFIETNIISKIYSDFVDRVAKRRFSSFVDAAGLFDTYFEQLTVTARAFKHRYDQAQASANPAYLLEAVEDKEEFNQRKRFSEKYGAMQDPARVDQFYRTHLKGKPAASAPKKKKKKKGATPQPKRTIASHVDSSNIEQWAQFEDELAQRSLSLELVLAQNPQHQAAIAQQVVAGEGWNAVTLLEFLKDYDEITSLVGDTKSFPQLSLPTHDSLIAAQDYDSMASYLDIAVVVESERERLKAFSKYAKPSAKKDDPDNNDVRLLLMEHFGFVSTNTKAIKELRAAYQKAQNPAGYVRLVRQLLEAKDDTEREQLVEMYQSFGEEMYQGDEELIVTTPAPLAAEQQKYHIDKLVIVGGYPRHQYSQRLSSHFEIGEIKVLPPNARSRIQSSDPNTRYILITNHMSHAAKDRIEAVADRSQIVYSQTSGNVTMITALKTFFE